jgi:hypothetical protein
MQRFVSALDNNDTVLTFNWDLLVGQTLLNLVTPCGALYTNFLLLVRGLRWLRKKWSELSE